MQNNELNPAYHLMHVFKGQSLNPKSTRNANDTLYIDSKILANNSIHKNLTKYMKLKKVFIKLVTWLGWGVGNICDYVD